LIRTSLDRPSRDLLVAAPDDDAAVWRGDPFVVATTDTMVEEIDFRSGWPGFDFRLLGRRLMSINLSDLAAMGAQPRHALISLALQRITKAVDAARLYRGIAEQAHRFGATVAGGDLSVTDGPMTMTATLVVDTTAYVAHVGDSRFYLYREPAGLLQIMQDHSLVAALAAAGVIQPEDIYTHPRRNLIYRCLGEKATVEVDTCAVPLAAGDILLLCSDGLWEMVRDRQIADVLTSPMPNPSRTAHALIQAALEGGGVDNVSAIVAKVSKVSPSIEGA